jgi:ATP-binding cassette, subfamily C, type I secretion system permease/ATPase
LMLGIGAYLVVIEQASGGIMIASSIMMGRALAPIEVALSTWRQLVAARQGIVRLREIVRATAQPSTPMVKLPRPGRALTVQNLTVFAPGTNRPIVSNVSFKLEAGMGLGLLGPSASGKSSLARALVGIWPAAHGEVRLDGATLDQWNSSDLGRHLGYLPQNVALFDGTIADNIARFDASASSESVIEAAHMAGAHEMILRLSNGYETQIGEGGISLSSGQRQRIGLARAAFGDPFLVVLDEPDANLDVDGENALARAVLALRAAGKIPIVISHRASVLAALNMALVIHNGRMIAFGTGDQVSEQVARSVGQKVPAASGQGSATARQDDRLPDGAQYHATV